MYCIFLLHQLRCKALGNRPGGGNAAQTVRERSGPEVPQKKTKRGKANEMKLSIVLWKSKNDQKWISDGIYESEATAQAKLNFEILDHPEWDHAIATFEVANPTPPVSK